MGIREGGNVKKCRPVVKEPSGGTLLFRCALPARGASVRPALFGDQRQLCLGAACTGCIYSRFCARMDGVLCLGAACTGCIPDNIRGTPLPLTLPRRCLHGVHLDPERYSRAHRDLCLGAACTGCIHGTWRPTPFPRTLPRRCLHGVHHIQAISIYQSVIFASALPARGASGGDSEAQYNAALCLGAACTGCIGKSRQIAAHHFVAYAVSR